MTLTGEFGAQYELDFSTNLVNWEALATLTNTYGQAQFTDPAGTNKVVGTDGTYRFYRAVLAP